MAELTASPADLLSGRIRRYFLVVFGMFAAGLGVLFLLGLGVSLIGLDNKTSGVVMGVAAPVVMLSVVVGSWVAVSKLWRCPACNVSVYWLVSWNASIFAARAPKNCPGCGVELYKPKNGTRRTLVLLLVAVAAVIMGIAVASASMVGKNRSVPQQQTPPIPPG